MINCVGHAHRSDAVVCEPVAVRNNRDSRADETSTTATAKLLMSERSRVDWSRSLEKLFTIYNFIMKRNSLKIKWGEIVWKLVDTFFTIFLYPSLNKKCCYRRLNVNHTVVIHRRKHVFFENTLTDGFYFF